MGNFIFLIYNLIRIAIVCAIAYVCYGLYTSFTTHAAQNRAEVVRMERAQADRDEALRVRDLSKYGRVLSNDERMARSVGEAFVNKLDSSVKALDAATKDSSTPSEPERYIASPSWLPQNLTLAPPKDDPKLDVVLIDAEKVLRENAGKFKQWLYLTVFDHMHYSMANVVIGRVSIPTQVSLPKDFDSRKPVAFMVGIQVGTNPITSKLYMIADCTVTDQTKTHHGWFADPTEGYKWSPLYNSLDNYNYAVAHQACWMAYPNFPVQTLIDAD